MSGRGPNAIQPRSTGFNRVERLTGVWYLDHSEYNLHFHREGSWMDDRWLSVDDIAEYLGVTRDTIYAWVSSKGMPGHKVGRYWRFKRDEVDSWVRAGGASSDRERPKRNEGDE